MMRPSTHMHQATVVKKAKQLKARYRQLAIISGLSNQSSANGAEEAQPRQATFGPRERVSMPTIPFLFPSPSSLLFFQVLCRPPLLAMSR
mmetsp:Transcript_11803/g.21033  ORF Transcript_11803/g.21033 Transcript_11803/m.21033 type:complete len:90 (-) Transcript_11803:168-437(-)